MNIQNIYKRTTKVVGPGVITGIADDDPSGIATYAQTGALFGLSQLWLSLYSLPFMIAVQEMCARIGMVTGNGLAGTIKTYYPKWLLYIAVLLLAVANIVNIGADLGAMGKAVSMISPLSVNIGLILITLFTIISTVFIPYHYYVKFLKYLAFSIAAYIITALLVKQDWGLIFYNVIIPHIQWNKEFLLNIMAFLGTTISPYLFFWQADEEVEEAIEKKKVTSFGMKPKVRNTDLHQMRMDTYTGMFFSNLVSFFIIITSFSALSHTSNSQMITALELAESLRPLAGDFAVYLFAFGILGTGLLAVPVLAGSLAYAVAETFHFDAGLSKTFRQAVSFYAVITVATLIGVILNFVNLDPMLMLYYSAAMNGLLAAPLLVIILFVANNKKILGDRVNGRWSNSLVIIITAIMAIISLFTIVSFIR